MVLATFQTTLEGYFHNIRISMPKQHILGFDAIEFLFLLLALFDVAMQLAIFGNRMSPEFPATTGLLANLQLDAFLFFILR